MDECDPTASTFGAIAAADNADASQSIFTAVEAQLGLKLQTAKGSGEYVVIDRVEHPSEN